MSIALPRCKIKVGKIEGTGRAVMFKVGRVAAFRPEYNGRGSKPQAWGAFRIGDIKGYAVWPIWILVQPKGKGWNVKKEWFSLLVRVKSAVHSRRIR